MWNQAYFWITWIGVAIFMEFWAMFLHGVLWHGPWWPTHKSHHTPRFGRFELNDLFAVFHATLAIGLIVYGFEAPPSLSAHLCIAVGFGMTTFGVAYFIVHDGFIHERLPVRFLERLPYLRRVRNAHRVHHRREHDAPFGLFLGEWELKRAKRLRLKRAQLSPRALKMSSPNR